jgi:hypothetical protein
LAIPAVLISDTSNFCGVAKFAIQIQEQERT